VSPDNGQLTGFSWRRRVFLAGDPSLFDPRLSYRPRVIRASLVLVVGLVVGLAVGLTLVACGDKKTEPDSKNSPSNAKGPPEADDPAVKPAKLPDGLVKPTPVARRPDAVYLTTDSALLAIKGGEFVKLAELPRFFGATDMTLDASGSLWVLGRDSIAKLEGSDFKTIKLTDGNGALKRIAVHDGDNIDVVGVYGISHFDGTGWTLAKSDDLLGGKSGGIQDLAIDGKGIGYASAYKQLLVRSDKIWKSLPADENLYSAMDIGADGALAVATNSGVLITVFSGADDAWRSIEFDCTSPKVLRLFADTLVVRCYDSALVVERKSGATKTIEIKKGGKLDVGLVSASAVDSKGRIYIGSKAGLFIIKEDGSVASFKLGSVALMESGPTALLATGAGADELPGEQAIRFGGISGRLLKRGKPLATVDVELCTNTSSFIKPGQTPCSEANWKTAGATGADGSFAFDKVPVGKLQFAYKPTGAAKWTLVIGFDCCAELKEGGKLDVGAIDMM
jgi:hypothetical protein